MQTFNLDLSAKRVIPLLYAKQRDVGAKIQVKLTDNKKEYAIPGGVTWSVWYSGASGEGNYDKIDDRDAVKVEGSTATVELIYQMLDNPGPGEMCLVMNSADGTQLGLWNIPYWAEALPGADSKAATAYYQAFLQAQAKAEAAAGRAEAAAENINVDQEYIETQVFAAGGSAEVAANAARDAAESEQRAKTDADRAEGAAQRAEEVAGSVGSPVSYKAQTLTKEEQTQARGNIGLAVFGVPYSSAAEVIDISAGGDGSVKLYLFATAEGFDAVVSGAGAVADYTEDNRPYDAQSICRLHIEKGITSIGSYFMHKAYNLKKLSFENSQAITHLGAYAFALTQIDGEYDFSGLTDTKLDNVFRNCRKLEGLTLNGKIAEITDMSFAVCPSLRYVKNIASVDVACTFGLGAFYYCTGLESVGVTPENTTLGNYVFLLTPIDAKVEETDTNLADAAWKSKGSLCFAQNEWTAEQLAAIRGVKIDSVQFPIPEADNQCAEMYKHWSVFWGIDNNWKDKVPAYGQCVHFSLFHVYNTMHPNAQYDTYYDFITREIAPKKIKVTQSLYDALHNSEVWEELVALNEQYNTGVTYALGDEISTTDLPVFLKYKEEEFTYYEEGTAFWGICEALGWSAEEIGFAEGVQSGADVKRTILDNLANNKPSVMFIVGAGNYGHAAHSVAVIGYDNETDRLLIIDSTDSFPADTIPLAYWREFETLITPNKRSEVFTFDFGEVITMTAIDDKLSALLQNASFRIEHGNGFTVEATSGGEAMILEIPCSPKPKMLIVKATQATQDKIVELTKSATTSPDYPYAWIYHDVGDLNQATGAVDASAQYGYQNKYVQYYGNVATQCENCSIGGTTAPRIATAPIYQGEDAKYEWTAYYWDE